MKHYFKICIILILLTLIFIYFCNNSNIIYKTNNKSIEGFRAWNSTLFINNILQDAQLRQKIISDVFNTRNIGLFKNINQRNRNIENNLKHLLKIMLFDLTKKSTNDKNLLTETEIKKILKYLTNKIEPGDNTINKEKKTSIFNNLERYKKGYKNSLLIEVINIIFNSKLRDGAKTTFDNNNLIDIFFKFNIYNNNELLHIFKIEIDQNGIEFNKNTLIVGLNKLVSDKKNPDITLFTKDSVATRNNNQPELELKVIKNNKFYVNQFYKKYKTYFNVDTSLNSDIYEYSPSVSPSGSEISKIKKNSNDYKNNLKTNLLNNVLSKFSKFININNRYFVYVTNFFNDNKKIFNLYLDINDITYLNNLYFYKNQYSIINNKYTTNENNLTMNTTNTYTNSGTFNFNVSNTNKSFYKRIFDNIGLVLDKYKEEGKEEIFITYNLEELYHVFYMIKQEHTIDKNLMIDYKYVILNDKSFNLKLENDLINSINKVDFDRLQLLLHVLNIAGDNNSRDRKICKNILFNFANVFEKCIFNILNNNQEGILNNKYLDYITINNSKKVYKYKDDTNRALFQNYYSLTLNMYDLIGSEIYFMLLEILYVNSKTFFDEKIKTKKIKLSRGCDDFKENTISPIDDSFMDNLGSFTIYTRNMNIYKRIMNDYKKIKFKIDNNKLNLCKEPSNKDKKFYYILENKYIINEINKKINDEISELAMKNSDLKKNIDKNTTLLNNNGIKLDKITVKDVSGTGIKKIEKNLNDFSDTLEKFTGNIEGFQNMCKDQKFNNNKDYVDNQKDLSSRQYSCEDYQKYGLCKSKKTTNKYISITDNELAMEAKDACCVCGGGINFCPAPCPEDELNSPGGSDEDENICEGPAPCPTITTEAPAEIINNLDKDKTIKITIPNTETKKQIKNFIKKIFNLNDVNIEYEESNNNLLIKLPEMVFNKLQGQSLLSLRKFFQCLYKTYYKTAFKKNISETQIMVEFIPGSLIIFIKILSKDRHFELTEEEKDLLEYHNFQRVFFKHLQPLSEYEYIMTRLNYLNKLN